MKENTKNILVGILIVIGAVMCFWVVPAYWEYECSIRGKIFQEANPRYCEPNFFTQSRSEE